MITQVIEKEVTTQDGKTLFLKIVQHGDKRGWMTRQLIEYFNKGPTYISEAATRAKVKGSKISGTQLDPLKKSNVVDINTTHMKFYNEEEVAKIAYHLKSDLAKEMLVYGFGIGVKAARGEELDIGLELDWKQTYRRDAHRMLELIDKLEKAEKEKVWAEAEVISLKDYAVSTAKVHGLVAKEIAEEFPLICKTALAWYSVKWPKVSLLNFPVSARITTYLKWMHGLSDRILTSELTKVKGHADLKERAMFNRADIEAVNNKLKGDK